MNTNQGTVKFFNETKGFGFVTPDAGGNDEFVHVTAVRDAGMTTLSEGQRVSYETGQGRNGKTQITKIASAD